MSLPYQSLDNGRQLILNTLSNNHFLLIRLAWKRKRDLDKRNEVKMGANSSEVAFFSFWFNLINFCLPRIGKQPIQRKPTI